MASSEKAGALKDAFVNAIANDLGEETMAEAGAMENSKLAGKLGLPVGNVASEVWDINRGRQEGINDGDARITMKGPRGNFTMNQRDSKIMGQAVFKDHGLDVPLDKVHDLLSYPNEGKGYGGKESIKNTPTEQRYLAEIYHSLKNANKY